MKKTVLIYGISSFVGANLAAILKNDFRVVGTYFKTPVEIPGVTCFPCDVLRKDYVNNITAIFKPDISIYAVGMSSLAECSAHPKLAEALHSAGANNCSRASERMGAKFVFISSGFVLGGENITYTEKDTPMPLTVYGNTMSMSEFFIQRSSINYIILRTCSLYGWSYNPQRPTWFDVVQQSMARSSPLTADDSVHVGYLDIQIFAKILKACLETNVTNRLLQVSSSDVMSRNDFAQLYARVFKSDDKIIQKTTVGLPIEDAPKKEKSLSQYYFKMDNTNIESVIGAKLPTIEESLLFTYKKLSKKD